MVQPRRSGRVLRSILLGMLTVALITVAATGLPYSPMVEEITGFASVPAQAMTRLVNPAAPKPGPGIQSWTVLYGVAGSLFYSVFWFLVLSLTGHSVARHAKRR